jgi:hypothetical protein
MGPLANALGLLHCALVRPQRAHTRACITRGAPTAFRSQGWIDLASGEVDLDFESSFATQLAGGLWATQPLAVAARMASGEQAGNVFHAVGEPLRGADAT